ncbi:hypothetical protein T484DRAFT_1777232, partial [Baffinella frigidus]
VRLSGEEVTKANHYIEKVLKEVQALKSKLKVKVAVIMQQDQSIEPERELVAQAAAHTRGQRVGHTRGQSIEQERVWREQVVQDKDEGLHARTLQVKELQKTVSEKEAEVKLLESRLGNETAKVLEAERTLASNQQVPLPPPTLLCFVQRFS